MLRNKDFLVLFIRLFLGYVFFSAGICKLTHGHFGQLIGPPWLEERLAQYSLALFAQVVAVSQVVCGALLLSQRFSTLGAIMLIPMNVSILAVTVSQDWTGTPYVNAVFLVLNLCLLFYEYPKFRFLFVTDSPAPIKPTPLDAFRVSSFTWVVLGIAFIMLLVAPSFYTATSVIAVLLFIALGILLCIPPILRLPEKILVAQALLNMALLTFGSPVLMKILVANTAIIALFLPVYLWLNFRRREISILPEIA